ncbi:hypothetical protein TNCV_3072741 [Trichonephila clavipes]|nr:hypothetical protein TNCV_3072741 [Trichonephila clavipes]
MESPSSWDEELPYSLTRQWRIFQEQLPLLTNIKIPSCILIPQAIDVQVYGGLENLADCGDERDTPTKLEKCNLWFNGPDWLGSSTFSDWRSLKIIHNYKNTCLPKPKEHPADYAERG